MRNYLCLAGTLLLTGQALAADTGFYFGVSGGRSEFDFEPPRAAVATAAPTPSLRLPPDLFSSGLIATTPGSGAVFVRPVAFVGPVAIPLRDDRDSTWSLLAGYRPFRYLSLEISYTDLGEVSHSRTFSSTLPSAPTSRVSESLETAGGSLTAIGILPVTTKWDVYVRGGAFHLKSEFESSFTSGVRGSGRWVETEKAEGWTLGLGTQLDLGAHWTVRAEFQRYYDAGKDFLIAEFDIDTLTLGVLYRL